MVKSLKEWADRVVRAAKAFAKELQVASQPTSVLITIDSHPELIEAVNDELKRQNAAMILGKLQDVEKAIYHLSSRQKELTERQILVEQHVVATNTTLEEMLHGFESDMDAWEEAKKGTTLN